VTDGAPGTGPGASSVPEPGRTLLSRLLARFDLLVRSRRGAAAIVLLGGAVPVLPLFFFRSLPCFRDGADFFIPIAAYTARALGGGALPLWNPASFAGEPWLAAVQPMVLYPSSVLYALLPGVGDAHRLVLLAHHLLLAAGLYRLARRTGLDRPASLLAATVAAFGAPLASVAGFENNLRTMAWFPWAIDAGLRGGKGGAARAGLCLALAFTAGEPQLAVVAALAVALALLSGGARAGEPGSSGPVGRLGEVGLAALVALLLSAPTLFPFLELWRESDRGAGLAGSELAREALDGRGLLELPGAPFFGVAGVDPLPPGRQAYLPVLSLGSAAAALALLSLGGARRGRAWILASAALILAAFLPSLPIVPLLDALHLPFRYPVRLAIPVALLAIPIAAARGWSRMGVAGRRSAVVPFALGGGLAAAVLLAGAPPRAVAPGVIGAVVVGLLLLAPRRSPASRAAALLLVAEALSLALLVPSESMPDSFALAPPWLAERAAAVAPGTRFFADPPSGRALLAPAGGFGRFSRSRALAFGYSNLLGVSRSAQGGGPMILRRYDRYLAAALRPGRIEPLLGALRVGAFLSLSPPPVSAPVEAISSHGSVTLWGWNGAFPRAWLVNRWQEAGSLDAAAGAISSPTFDPSRSAVVESAGRLPPLPSGSTAGSATLLVEERERLEFQCRSGATSLLVVPDAWYPGWKARVDGKEAPIHPVDVLFRGIFVPAGDRRVELVYEPSSLRRGLLAGAVGIVLFAVILLSGLRRRRSVK
jgi:hypothetical protein